MITDANNERIHLSLLENLSVQGFNPSTWAGMVPKDPFSSKEVVDESTL
uniref:Uncharacterized protein MANES_11G033500 n=1 Tax=Rhizophora mucronata TaxID=61149 RepID=A0A2P2KHL7_RHIMU